MGDGQTGEIAVGEEWILRTLDAYFDVFLRLAEKARRCLQEGEFESSAAWIQLAGQYAWFHPTGVLASRQLETYLAEIAGTIPREGSGSGRILCTAPRRILHVLSEVYALGGHTRLVWRWIRADVQREHSIALTRQMESDLPAPLASAVTESGGGFHFLDRHAEGIIARARELRRIARDFDHVVIHAHPWDVVPPIAFMGDKDHPALTLMNKDDHVFWLGANMADQVAQMRFSGWRLCRDRRGISESRCRLLPLPIEVPAEPRRREEARRELGIDDKVQVLVSVASAYKYESAGKHFTDVLLPLLESRPHTILFVLGPEARGIWASSAERCGGRLRVLGKRNDTALYYRAADIYLDSFPLNSLTSVLEAGSYGTPIVSYFPYSTQAEVLFTDDVALSGVSLLARSPNEYREQISRLLDDGMLNRATGDVTRERIIAAHTGTGWLKYLEELYANAPQDRVVDRSCLAERHVTELEITLALTYAAAGLSRDLQKDIRNHLGMFPLKARMSIWAGELGGGLRTLPACLLSDRQKTRLRLLRSQMTRAVLRSVLPQSQSRATAEPQMSGGRA